MKKTYFLILGLVILAFAPHAFAEGFTALAPIPGLTDSPSVTSALDGRSLAVFFNNLYKYLLGLAAVFAVIEIIWAGTSIALHQDSVSEVMASKGRINRAVFGLIIVLSPYLVFSLINPNILNLSLNIPPIDIKTGDLSGANSSNTTGTQTSTSSATTNGAGSNCAITGTLLKTAVCPTQKEAEEYAASCTTGSGNVSFSITQHKATCGTERGSVTGPYSFADVSQSTGFVGFINKITGYSYYEPLESTASNSSNGSSVLQFASACTADGGTTCMSAFKAPCISSIVQVLSKQSISSSASCWDIALFCTEEESGAGGCSSDPEFTIVKTK